jgi:response regulator RpfG family c-di-GMP phosphodiesterase
LIVDDKESNLSVMSGILKVDYHVLEARDGLEALALIENMEDRASLACIISDYRMPRLNGVELLERAQLLVPDALRIIVTGFIDIDAIIDSINRGGIYKLIVKPFEVNDFLTAAQGAVKKFDAQRDLLSQLKKLSHMTP